MKEEGDGDFEKDLRRKSLRDRTVKYSITIISLLGFLATWWILAIIANSVYLPAPDAVANAFWVAITEGDPVTGLTMGEHVTASLWRFAWGFAIALLLAIPLGLFMGFSKYADYFGKPVVEVFRPIPPLAWAPLLLVMLSIFWGPVITIFIGVFFPILSNVAFGVRSVDPLLYDVAKTQGARKIDLFTKVVFPFTIPFLMTGIRIGLGIGWMCIVAAEFIASTGGGVGALILTTANISFYEFTYAGIVMIAILGLATTEASRYLERRVSLWMGME
jgi:ABC-type nitrate/sulfonate/bicarbonate transport system permease component